MRHSILLAATVASIAATSAFARQDFSGSPGAERIRQVTAPPHAIEGTLDLRTGRFQRTRNAGVGNDGKREVYDNTCATGFYLGLDPAGPGGTGSACPETLGDWGAIPSTAFPGDATCTTGCADAYDITQFEIAWCQLAGPPSGSQILLHFWSAPLPTCWSGAPHPMGTTCAGGVPAPAVPTAFSTVLTGLPRTNSIGTLTCYVLTVTLSTPGFRMTGSNTFSQVAGPGDPFAWSFTMPTSTGADGPILAGDLTPFSSPCAPCAGTLWEVGGQTTGQGTGAGQTNAVFWEDYGGTSVPGGGAGTCYYFGSLAPVGIHLELFADKPCFATSFGTFCDSTDGSLASCPCGPGLPDSGCDSPIPPGQGGGTTGGIRLQLFSQQLAPNNRATLSATGFPSASVPAGVVFRNTGIDPSSPVVFGDGLRCVDAVASPGTLVRLGAAVAAGGSMRNAFGHGPMAGSGTFFYQLWFRSTPISYCDPASAFNTSNGVSLVW